MQFIITITDNLCTKQGNVVLKSAVSNQERVIMEHVQYIKPRNLLATLIFQVQGKYSILTEKNVLMSSCEFIALLRNSKDKILI